MPTANDLSGVPARRSAAWMLDQVLGEGRLVSELITQGALDRLTAPDRARAQRLAIQTLRNLAAADNLIAKHAKKKPPLPIHNLLRLGAVELAQGTAAHAVVNDLVTLASKTKRHGKLKGLVNAVLRKLTEHAAHDWPNQPHPKMPSWLRDPLVDAWGEAAIGTMERVQSVQPPLDITVKHAQMTLPFEAELLPTGSFRIQSYGQISALAGFDDGDWWVQDAAAAVPAKLITGDRVLDMCAAPGGKTMQMAALGKSVTAADLSASRMKVLEANLSRTGLRAEIRIEDALTIQGKWDAVLLDAPCSATGTLRRHPDLPYAKDGSEFGALIEQQSALLDHAISLIPPGGQIVYCTCSLLPDEGEVQIEDALERHSNLELDSAAMDLPWIEDAWRSPEGGLRLRPDMWADRGGMDGFYIAALRKTP